MKNLLRVALLLVLPLAGFWAGTRVARHSPPAAAPADGRKILYYVDPMNPAHTSDKPGKAPCGMEMEPVYADSAAPAAAAGPGTPSLPQGTIRVSPEKQQLIGVRVAPVEKRKLVHPIRLLGKVATDETRIYRLSATVDGWITKTLPYAAGSLVKKDEILGGFYSPEFLSAGQALLFALDSVDRVQRTGKENPAQQAQLAQFDLSLKQYRDSLRNLGMGNLQIEEMIRTRKFIENVDITSPANGFILARNISDGQRFDKGTEMFRIADLSQVWILVDVFEKDAGAIQTDQPVKVSLPTQGKTFTARVSKTLPQFDTVTRTLKLRLEAENADFALKPDMFVDVELPLSLPESILIPAEAVVNAGLRQTVYVERGSGYFEPRNIQIGSRVGEMVQVAQGLSVGERIVTSGNFLLDSESRMKLAASGRISAPATDPVCGMAVDETSAKTAQRSSQYQGKTYYFCSDGCRKKFDAAPARILDQSTKMPPPAETAEAPPAKDPVCGMKVDPADARAAGLVTEHRGATFYFCNESCKKQFDQTPAKYAMADGSK